MIVAKLYSNTMLLALNNRIAIIGGRDDEITGPDYQYGIQDLSQWELRNRPCSESEQVTSRGDNTGVREDATGIDQLKPVSVTLSRSCVGSNIITHSYRNTTYVPKSRGQLEPFTRSKILNHNTFIGRSPIYSSSKISGSAKPVSSDITAVDIYRALAVKRGWPTQN